MKKIATDMHGRFLNQEHPFGEKHPTSTVYVEGLPADTCEREVSHIFRPF